MRIAVMGSGAVGGYFGAKLANAGHSVAFLARGKHLAAMREQGLKIDSATGNLLVREASFSDNAELVGKVDVVLVCVKSYDSETAARTIAPMISPNTIILSLQNGIENPAILGRHHGKDRILAGVVYLGAQLTGPRVVTHSTGGKIVFGRLNGVIDEIVKALDGTLTAAGIPCEASADIGKVQWTKLLWNAPFCAISCLTYSDTHEIVASPALTELALACMSEVQAAARTAGVDLPDELRGSTIEFSKTLGNFKPSMRQDLEAHKPLEFEAFNGVVVRRLEAAGQNAPVNRGFYTMLRFLDERIRKEATR
jgi:2-dehydropantoate 2-reductase